MDGILAHSEVVTCGILVMAKTFSARIWATSHCKTQGKEKVVCYSTQNMQRIS
jgi:hypothetical protein